MLQTYEKEALVVLAVVCWPFASGLLIVRSWRLTIAFIFGLAYWIGHSFAIRDRINVEICLGTSHYLPRIFSEPDYQTMIDNDGHSVSAAALRLMRARMVHLRFGINYMF